MSFASSLERLSSDPLISSYFIDNHVDLFDFVSRYIQVDKLVNIPYHISPDTLSTKICQLQLDLSNQNSLLHSLSLSFNNFKDSLKDITNHELKTILSNHLNSIQSHLTDNPHSLKESLQLFQDKLFNLNSQQLNDLDRNTLNTLSNFQSNLLKDLSTTLDSHTIHHKISSIHDTVTSLNNNFTSNSSLKGQMTENILFHNLLSAFPDSDVLLTRDLSDSCDIQIKRDGKPPILIDSKHCQASNVRKLDLDKFYDDCKINNSSGILCNAFGGIANRKHLEIDIQDKRVLVFLSNHQFDQQLFLLASRIIYNVHDIIKDQHLDLVPLNKHLYQQLKIEYNHFLLSFQQYLDNIKSNLNSLSQLSLNHLDNFFKRTNFSNQLKPLSCTLCATGFTSPKALKSHLKLKHPTFIQPTSTTPTD